MEYIAKLEKENEEKDAEIAVLKSRLPQEMKNRRILFIECAVGHGRLMGKNWIDRGCPYCKIAALKERIRELEAERRTNALDGQAAYDIICTENRQLRQGMAELIMWIKGDKNKC